MPRYATIADLRARLVDTHIQLGATSVPTAAQAESIIEQVEAEIHAYLQHRYQLPLTDAESILFIKSLAVSLCCERIYTLAYPQSPSNPFRPEADAARDLLKHIMRGDAQIPTTQSPIGGAYADFGGASPKYKVGEIH